MQATNHGIKIAFDSKVAKELTVSPLDFQSNIRICYPIYIQGRTSMYVPKYYYIEKYGKITFNEPIDLNCNIKFNGCLREEQKEPVDKMLEACYDENRMGGLLNVFCGGGKTTMALYIAHKLNKKTLIIVHKNFLLDQWKDRINEFLPGTLIGFIKGKTIDIDKKDIVIASLQSLSMKDYDDGIFNGFGTLIVDEVHHTSAQVFNKALFKTCFKYSIGLSATIERKDGLEKVFKWHIGPIVYKATQRQDTVIIQAIKYYNPNFREVHINSIHGPTKLNYSRMLNNLCEDEDRNSMLVDLIRNIDKKRKTLVLSDRIQQLNTIKSCLENKYNFDCGIYIGGMKSSALIECEHKSIIFATYAIASEGYDQKGLNTLILASPRSDITQSIGRILRDKAIDRLFIPHVYDIYDNCSVYIKQWSKRKSYYKKNEYLIQYLHNQHPQKNDEDEVTIKIPTFAL